MTLNITVLTKRAIYQCADFRFVNNQTKQASDLQEQMKVQACAGSGWSASVCFNGVGTTSTGLSVSEWLIEKLNTLRPFESEFEELVALLRSADDWLGNEPPPYNRHTFTIGAFIQGRPLFGLVSNYEKLSGAIASIAYSVLDYEFTWVKGSRSIASGSGKVALTRETLNRLTNLGSVHQAPDPVFTALAAANEGVAAVLGPGGSVSRACFTTYLSRTGEGASKPHNIAVSRLNFPAFPGKCV